MDVTVTSVKLMREVYSPAITDTIELNNDNSIMDNDGGSGGGIYGMPHVIVKKALTEKLL